MNTTSLWNDQVPSREGQRSPIHDIAISPDGTRIIVAVGNRVLLYNAEIGDLLESLKGHKNNVYCVDFSADGSRFSSGGADNTVVIWKSTGQGMLKYSHTAAIQKVKYCPNIMQLVSCSEVDFGIWNPEQKQVVKEKVPSKILSAAWSCDGSMLALGLLNGWIMLRDSHGHELHRIERKAPIWCLQFISGASGATNTMLGVSMGKNTSAGGTSSPTGLSSNSETDLLVVGCWDKTLSLYKVNNTAHRIQGERSLRYYPCGLTIANLQGNKTNYMIISGSNRKVTLYSRDGMRLADLCAKNCWMWCASCHSDSDRVVVGSDDGHIELLQMSFDAVHALYKDRYAYRENLTEVVVHHLISDRKVRIKCRDYVQRLSLYKNKLAVQLSDKVCIYESNPDETQDMHFRLRRERIHASNTIPCESMIITGINILFFETNIAQMFSFDGVLLRQWSLESNITCVKISSGPEGKEGIILGLQNGLVCKLYIDNIAAIDITRRNSPIKCIDMSLNREKIAIVDKENVLTIIELKSQNIIFTTTNVNGVCFNTEVDDMLCYSSMDQSIYVISGLVSKVDSNATPSGSEKDVVEPQQQFLFLYGYPIGYNGQKIFCLYHNNMVGLDVPQNVNIVKAVELNDYTNAYHIACLGATENDWKYLGMKSLRHNHLQIARNCFNRLKDNKFLYLIDQVEKHITNGGSVTNTAGTASSNGGESIFNMKANIGVGRTNESGTVATSTSTASGTKRIRGIEKTSEKSSVNSTVVVHAPLPVQFQAEILAYEGHVHEAAKAYARSGNITEAIRVFTDLRLWNEAKQLAESSNIPNLVNTLIQKQAKWLHEINDWKASSEIYVSMNQYMNAAKIINDLGLGSNGWQLALQHVVRSCPKEETDVLIYCGNLFLMSNEDDYAREVYFKLGNINKIMEIYIKRENWVEAAKLANENDGKFDSHMFLPYAEWLLTQDKYDEAINAFKKANRYDLSHKVLNELTFNSIVECRFKDAAYYYWLMSKELTTTLNTNISILNSKKSSSLSDEEREKLKIIQQENMLKQLEYEHNSDLYYAYSHIHAYITDPFTNQHPDMLFQVSRFIINSLGNLDVIPHGISKACTIYTLAKHSMILGTYKLARFAYDRLQKLIIASRWLEDIEREMLIVQAKPVRDEQEHLPVCYRCGSVNPLLNPFTNKFAKGDVCTNCGHPFVRSFINFDILPLVEFVPELSISDEEAIELIRTPPNLRSGNNMNQWNEGKMGESDFMNFGSTDTNPDDVVNDNFFTNCLNKALEGQMNAMSYIPITVDTNTLLNGMKRSEVFVCRPSSPNKRATFYKNMLPDIAIAISQSCHRFFHLEDFEFSYLSNKSCPFSRICDVGEYGSL